MQAPAAIVGTIAIVCLAEVLLLFSIAVPATDVFVPRSHQIVSEILGLGLILGLAAFFSCVNYGLRGWQRRVLSIVAVPTVAFFAFVGVVWLGNELLQNIPYEQEERVEIGFFSVVLLVVCCLIVMGWKISRQRGLNIEAQHWLDERHSGTTRTEIAQRHRVIRTALWLPSIIVVLALLFLPETWALLSHAVHGGRHQFRGHIVSIPATWVVLVAEDDRLAFGVVAPGFGRHPAQWLRDGGIPISSWGFSVYDAPLPDRDHNQIIETRIFPAKNGWITCVQNVPNWWSNVNGRYSRIDCSGPNGFSAYMEGETRDVPTFFAVVSRIR